MILEIYSAWSSKIISVFDLEKFSVSLEPIRIQ